LALYALFGVVINQSCFVEGLSRTTPIHSSIINTTIPVGTLTFAVLLAFGTLGMLLPGLTTLPGFDPAGVSLRTWGLGAVYLALLPRRVSS